MSIVDAGSARILKYQSQETRLAASGLAVCQLARALLDCEAASSGLNAPSSASATIATIATFSKRTAGRSLYVAAVAMPYIYFVRFVHALSSHYDVIVQRTKNPISCICITRTRRQH